MGAADRHGHPADADGERIPAERTLMERFDADAFVKAKVAQAKRRGVIKPGPIDRLDTRTNPDAQDFKGESLAHVASDYQ